MIEDYFINHNYKFLNKKNKKGMFVLNIVIINI